MRRKRQSFGLKVYNIFYLRQQSQDIRELSSSVWCRPFHLKLVLGIRNKTQRKTQVWPLSHFRHFLINFATTDLEKLVELEHGMHVEVWWGHVIVTLGHLLPNLCLLANWGQKVVFVTAAQSLNKCSWNWQKGVVSIVVFAFYSILSWWYISPEINFSKDTIRRLRWYFSFS